MISKKETLLKIKIKGKDIDNLKTAIDKVIGNETQIGFKGTSFSDDEHKVLKNLAKSLK